MSLLGPFEALAVVAGVALVLGMRALRNEHRAQHDILAFDVIRLGLVIVGVQFVIAIATILDPESMGPLPITRGVAFGIGSIALGWAHFFWFRHQANQGTHPWQRQPKTLNISEAAVTAETTDP